MIRLKNKMTTTGNKKTVISHLEDLRFVFIRSLIYIIAASAVSFFFADKIIDIIKFPSKDIITGFYILKPTDSVAIYFKTIMYGAFVAAFLPVMYEIVNFIRPAFQKEQFFFIIKWTVFSMFLFVIGTLFVYFAVLPVSIKFLIGLASSLTAAGSQVSFNAYVSFVLTLLLCGGITFQIPLICAVLTMVNLITPFMLSKFRKEIFFGLCVFAAVITPTTDVFSMMLFVVPMIVLYEIGIFISSAVYKNKAAEIDKIYDGAKYD